MINKKDYPLVLLKEVQKLYKEIRELASDNDDIIEITKNEEFEITLQDRSENSNFSFKINNPRYERGKVEFIIEYNPRNGQILSPLKTSSPYQQVLNHLNIWIKLLREYDTIYLSPEEKILQNYEEEFYTEFEIIDEDAEIQSYDLKTQTIINNFLVLSIEVLKKNDNENILLIEEAESLKDDLTKLSKKATVKRLSRFFALIRQKSLPLLKEIFELGKKELFKRALNGGFDFLGHFLS